MEHFHRKGWGWAVLGAAALDTLFSIKPNGWMLALGPSDPFCQTITTVSSPSLNPKEGQEISVSDLLSSKMTQRTPTPSYTQV